ncbi:cytochrome P450 [Streptomyces viridochromogenes DSM 40736]|uniref:Cytochrome P450 n=1 Tax=Streptomyces viridochromogenes (strain DSM 40736 / JCM 4977 / BCRC 1201 / Tue 494) TaxID=591159 RepID=D9X1T9_STRVT|nr:cytochrome P450 [Streptomyces viridochromogenes]EFL29511.1 cytochrome P450 [Streptomyces viridochromogenes DSM 40736]
MTYSPHSVGYQSVALPLPTCPEHPGRVQLSGLSLEPTVYDRMREAQGNVVEVELEDHVPAYLVIGSEEFREACRRTDRFTPDSRAWSEWGQVKPGWPWKPQVAYLQGSARFATGDEHWQLRNLLSSGLEKVSTAQLRAFTVREADRLIDRFCQSGKADLVADYAIPLPLLVMLRLVGLPHDAGQRLLMLMPRLLEGGEGAQAANDEINSILDELVAARRDQPANDYTSWLIHHSSSADAQQLSDAKVRNLVWTTVLAGFGGCANWISNVMEQLVRKTRFQALLAAGEATVDEIMVETCWDNPPVANVMGPFALTDSVLGGRLIPRGAMLIRGIAASNTDPTLSGDRHAWTLGNESHNGWGAGPHECPAQRTAKIIVRTAVKAFLARCWAPVLENPEKPPKRSSFIVRALDELPVSFAPSVPVLARPTPDQTALGDAGWNSRSLFPRQMLDELQCPFTR